MSTCQVEYVRKVAGTESGHAVELMPPPSYLQALLYEGNRKPIPGVSSDIILVYKSRVKSSTSSLPIDVPDEINDSLDTSADLIGDPLPAPFDENDELQVSFHERKEYLWPKGELNHYPLQKQEALNILDQCDETSSKFDVWCLVDGGVSNKPVEMNESLNGFSNGNHSADASILDSTITDGFNSTKYSKMSRILLGVHATGEWWTSSYVTSQGLCSASSREMDPEFMITAHHDILPSHKMNVSVLCRYNIAGERLTSSVPSSATSACCVSLELKWRTPTLNVPSEDVFADVVVQASVGHKSSPAHGLWKQLCILENLFEVLLTCRRSKTTPEMLPHLEPALNGSIDCEIPQEPLQSRIQTLILGGKQALQAQTAYRMSIVPSLLARQSLAPGRLSVAPSLLGRQSTAPGFLDRMSPAQQEEIVEDGVSCSIIEALELAAAGNRENSDITDGIFSLLIECTTYPELVSAWELIFMELHNAHRAPFVRPRNSTRAAKLIQGFEPGQSGELKGTLLGLELLFELGLEKLTTDYNYVFLKSLLVARGELQAPQLIRSNIGVPKEKWHDSCGKLLGWLAQVHCALEMALPLENPMNYIAKCMASKALKHFTSENSPVRSVESLLTPGNSIQEFSLPVPSKVVHEHAHRNFDWWRMSVTSETSARRVKSVFLRSRLHPIFPPQLCDDSDTLITTEGSVHFYCAEAVTESQKL